MALSATPRRLTLLCGMGPAEGARARPPEDPPGCRAREPGRGASSARGHSGPRSSCEGNKSVSSARPGPAPLCRPLLLQPLWWAAPPQPSAAAPGGLGPAAQRPTQPGRCDVCGFPHEPLNLLPDTEVTKKYCSSCRASIQKPPRGSEHKILCSERRSPPHSALAPHTPPPVCSGTPACPRGPPDSWFIQIDLSFEALLHPPPCLGPQSHPRCWKSSQPLPRTGASESSRRHTSLPGLRRQKLPFCFLANL